MAKIKPYSLNKNKYLLDHEIKELEQTLKNYLTKEKRDTALIFLALYTGARATELLNLKKSDLDRYDQSIFIRGIKGSNDREIPLPSWLFHHLELLSDHTSEESSFFSKASRSYLLNSSTRLNHKKNCSFFFSITYNRLRQIWVLYRPVEKKFHCLRHTFAIRLYQKTKDLRLLQMALGHRNISNTMIYSQYLYSKKELKKLIL